MSRVSFQRIWATGAGFAFLGLVAVVAQLRDGIPIYAEVGPVETAEVGFMALLAVLSLRVLFVVEDVGAARNWLFAAAASFAASGINDVVGFSEAFAWIEPFDDVSAILSWIGAILLLVATIRLRSLPASTAVSIGAGFALHVATLLIDLAAAKVAAPVTGILANLAELAELSAYATYATGMALLAWVVLAPVAVAPKAFASPWPMELVENCDLCGSKDLCEVVRASATTCRTVLCDSCGLLFASPMIHRASLDRFFADGFDGDPGAGIRISRDDSLMRKARQAERSAREWAMPLIQRHMDIRGKRILDIRSRTGTLAKAMIERGAHVVGLDPLQPNVDYARTVSGLGAISFMPISRLAELRGIADGSFDAVTILTVHILSHLPSPRCHLRRIFESLRPGGLVFIDEKHALRPAKAAKASLFGTRPVHTVHFTEETLARYLRTVGFEILECGLDQSRTSAFRHLLVVARKPVGPSGVHAKTERLSSADREHLLSEIADAQKRLDRVRSLNSLRRRAKSLVRQISG